jgi:hypothetical protein
MLFVHQLTQRAKQKLSLGDLFNWRRETHQAEIEVVRVEQLDREIPVVAQNRGLDRVTDLAHGRITNRFRQLGDDLDLGHNRMSIAR